MSPRVLMTYWHHGGAMRYAVERHLQSLDGAPVNVVYLNTFGRPPRWIRRLEFDAVVLHTVFLGMRWHDGFDEFARSFAWLRDAAPVKIAIPQDEYDHSEVLDDWLNDLGVNVVFSNFADSRLPILYPKLHSRARFRPALTGYIDDAAAMRCAGSIRPLEERPYDIVYRATKLPYWFGSHGQLKHRIADVVGPRARTHGLTTDVSTEARDTIYGDAWLDFLSRGRAIIGAESGSSVLDRRGEIQRRIKELLATEPDLTFEEVDARMPPGWDSYAFHAISPRHLEAVITKTCQLLVEGTYDGVLEPDRHYLPIRRDFSNLDDVLAALHDHERVRELTERAYEEVYLHGSYRYSDLARHLVDEVPRGSMRVRRAVAPSVVVAGKAANRLEHATTWRARAVFSRVRAVALGRQAAPSDP